MIPVFTIFLGDAKTMYMKLQTQNCDGFDPIDLTNCTQIVVNLPKNDGTFIQKNLTGGVTITQPPTMGKFSVAIDSGTSALLNVGELQFLDVTFTIGSAVTTVRYPNCFSVFAVA